MADRSGGFRKRRSSLARSSSVVELVGNERFLNLLQSRKRLRALGLVRSHPPVIILAELGVAPRRAMYLGGHTDPRFTMRVYQQVLDAGPQTVELLEAILGCGLEEAFETYSGRRVSGLKPDSGGKHPQQHNSRDALRDGLEAL